MQALNFNKHCVNRFELNRENSSLVQSVLIFQMREDLIISGKTQEYGKDQIRNLRPSHEKLN